MSMSGAHKPRICVLTAAGDAMLPGLDPLDGSAEIVHVDGETDLARTLPETDVLVVTDFRTEALRRAWPNRHSIRWLHATSAGVDRLMFPELVDSDVVVTNARGVFDRGIAEYVLGAVLMFAKDTLTNVRLQQAHEWRHRETELLVGRRALVVGAGSIGREVARLLRCVGMHVTATATAAREDPSFDAVHASEALPELLPESDFVVITAPLTDATHGLFDESTFARMHPGARLINVGRGPIVRTDALVNALQEGRLGGAALDVFETEPLDPESPLWDMPNVMISAHMAGDFVGWERALGEQFVANFQRWQRGEPLLNLVDKARGYAQSSATP
ncbi:MAG: D-2-hydroxyacid dehydrogenase [Gammaproteobacteria bacterium]|nr:D-2-hydroxyacid dehydrogenase [Gammaproteobacteria bacterium]